jgi:hypothetical protein
MVGRRLWLLGAVILAADACTASTSTEGSLGNGSFSYVCPNGSDNGCDSVTGDLAAIPSAIAVGAGFTIAYQVGPGGGFAHAPESTTPSILEAIPGASTTASDVGESAGFQFVGEGTAGVIVPGLGGVIDFVSVTGRDVAALGAFSSTFWPLCHNVGGPGPGGGGTGDGGAPDAGTGGGGSVEGMGQEILEQGQALDVNLEPVDADGDRLAGDVPVVVSSSDDTIVSVGPGFADPSSVSLSGVGSGIGAHAFELCGQGPGEAVITVTIAGRTASFPVIVTPSDVP